MKRGDTVTYNGKQYKVTHIYRSKECPAYVDLELIGNSKVVELSINVLELGK